jgi:hypothetical protein
MRSFILVTLAVCVVAGGAATAGAVGSIKSTARYIKRGYHQNVIWPWPYVCPDRAAVREPFAMMVNNGWRRQNLLGEHHFNANSDQLSTAGELKVHWITTQAPPERRNIYVERSLNPEVTERRLAAARDYAARVETGGQVPQVFDTHLVSEGRPAATVDATNVRFQESMPPPVLPAVSGAMVGGGD